MTLTRVVLVLAVVAFPLVACQDGTRSDPAAPPPAADSTTAEQPAPAPSAEGNGPEAPGPTQNGKLSLSVATAPFGLSGVEGDCYSVALSPSPPAGVEVRITDVVVQPDGLFDVDKSGCAGSGCPDTTLTAADNTCSFTATPTGTGNTAQVRVPAVVTCPADERQYCLDGPSGAPQDMPQPDTTEPTEPTETT
jgi:hypothetical protein